MLALSMSIRLTPRSASRSSVSGQKRAGPGPIAWGPAGSSAPARAGAWLAPRAGHGPDQASAAAGRSRWHGSPCRGPERAPVAGGRRGCRPRRNAAAHRRGRPHGATGGGWRHSPGSPGPGWRPSAAGRGHRPETPERQRGWGGIYPRSVAWALTLLAPEFRGVAYFRQAAHFLERLE